MYLKLFLIFFKLGFFSFGGGYTMIPLIEQQLLNYNLHLNSEVFSKIIAVAGVAPGPIGMNLAIGFGYSFGGIPGMIATSLGVALPSLLIIIFISKLIKNIYNTPEYVGALDALKPTIVGITFYSALNFGMKNGIFFAKNINIIGNKFNFEIFNKTFSAPLLLMVIISFFILKNTKLNPVILIIAGGLAGIFIF